MLCRGQQSLYLTPNSLLFTFSMDSNPYSSRLPVYGLLGTAVPTIIIKGLLSKKPNEDISSPTMWSLLYGIMLDMKRLLWLLILPLLSFSFTPQEAALQAENKLKSIHTLQAKFEQLYYSSSISTPLHEKGNFYFQRPDLMKWEYKEPEKKIFLYKQGTFEFYIPEDNQLIRSSLAQEAHKSEIVTLLSGKGRIIDNYKVEFSSFPSDNSKAIQLKLTPKEETDYTFILLEIDRRDWLIHKIIFLDWAGNKTEFIFSKIKINRDLGKKIFELKLPPDVEIIENQIN